MALEAIYGDNLEIFCDKSVPRSFQVYLFSIFLLEVIIVVLIGSGLPGLSSCPKNAMNFLQIHVYCEIPDGISVSAELLQVVDDHPKKHLFDTLSVEHLAPISLTCLLPPSYPSHHSPYFTLGVQWLDAVKISSLCHMLESMWAQQPGQEVIFEWVQWLQSSTLSHLGFDGGIVIQQSDSMIDSVDVRVVGEILSVEDVVQRLINYNEEQCQESFLHAHHVCMICFSEYKGNSDAPLMLGYSPWCSFFTTLCIGPSLIFQDLAFVILQLQLCRNEKLLFLNSKGEC
jgi:E3 ubiquitin-protein ligase RNF14